MKNKIIKALAAVVLMAAFCVSAFAADYYSSDESGNVSIPDYIASIKISEESVSIPESSKKNTYQLTPDGNLTLVDDYYQVENEGSDKVQQKQFLTVTTKSGNTFYIIVDRDGTTDNVHLLNMVDEADLLALLGDEPTTEKPTESTTKEEESTEKEEPDTKKEKSSKSGSALVIVLILAGGGFAFYWFKLRNKGGKPKTTDTDNSYPEFDEPGDSNEESEEQD